MYYVYALLDENGKEFYIGKGKIKRIKYHFKKTSLDLSNPRNYNKYKINKILKVKKVTDNWPEIKILFETSNEQEAFEQEKFLILKIGRENLTNMTDGGEGASNPSEETRKIKRDKMIGRVFTEEHKQKLKESATGRPGTRKGIKCSEETKKKMSESAKKYIKTPEHCKNISNSHKGKKIGPYKKRKIKE